MKKFSNLYKQLYFQVIVSIGAGILLGYFYPDLATKLKPLSDGFIKLIRMMIPSIIFTTIVIGINNMKDPKEARRIGIKAIIYFETVTALASVIGLLVVNYYQPGSELNINSIDNSSLANYSNQALSLHITDFFLNIIPDNFANAFVKGDILPILFVAILFGFGLLHTGEKVKPIAVFIEQISKILFSIIKFIMTITPIATFSAMAYTVSTEGISILFTLSKLLISVYLSSLLFIFIVLGLIAKLTKFSLWNFLKYIKEELLIVLGTASTETVLPQIISKLEKLGCGKSVVGLVLPAGYTFNLDGTSLYLIIAILFIAQAFNIHFSLMQQLTIVAILLLTSKGATITGGGFIALATIITTWHIVPTQGLVILLSIDRFMSEARALTNLIGNSVATVVIAKWEKDFNSTLAEKFIGSSNKLNNSAS